MFAWLSRLLEAKPQDERDTLQLSEILDDYITSLHVGFDESSGKQSAEAFVLLRGEAVLCLQASRVTVAGWLPENVSTTDLRDELGAGCVGRQVQDVLQVGSGTVLVLLDDGRYIANGATPGGTSFHLARFSKWAPDTLAQPAKSLATGDAKDLRKYLAQ